MIYFVDTGILLRAVDRNDPVRPQIVAAFRVLRNRGDDFATSTQNLREFWNVATRPASARGGYGRTIAEAASRVATFRRLLQIVGETAATLPIWLDLVERCQVHGAQVHDAHLVALMQTHGITKLLTLNGQDFRRFAGIEVTSPTTIVAEPA